MFVVLGTMVITFRIQIFKPRTIRTAATVDAFQKMSLVPNQPGEMTVVAVERIYLVKQHMLAINSHLMLTIDLKCYCFERRGQHPTLDASTSDASAPANSRKR
jgi:hypothetical protein